MLQRTLLSALFAVAVVAQAQDTPPPAPAENEAPRLAILPIKGTVSNTFVVDQDNLMQDITTAFMNTKKFTLVERSQLQAVLGEGKFQNSGLVDDASAAELGKQLGVKFVMVGSFQGDNKKSREVSGMKAGLSVGMTLLGLQRKEDTANNLESDFWKATAKLNLRMVEVQTGKIVQVFESEVKPGDVRTMNQAKSTGEALQKLKTQLYAKIWDAYPQTGYVIKVLGPKELMIDMGSEQGITPTHRFAVTSRDEDIVHPVTGAIIKGKKNLLATYKVKAVDATTAVLVLDSKDAKEVKIGQVVEVLPTAAK